MPWLLGSELTLSFPAVPMNTSWSSSNGLRQLSSCPVSAVAFYENLLSLHQNRNLALPLGSVDLLLSLIPGQPQLTAPGLPVRDATFQTIKDAFEEWRIRCEENPDNIAMLYFAGHGLSHTDQYLLASDFGTLPANPFAHSFNFDRTRLALSKRKINHQVFLIDACREVSDSTLTYSIPENQLLPINLVKRDCDSTLLLRSSAANYAAYGLENAVSFFTTALIKALNGLVAEKVQGRWQVQSTGLHNHLGSLASRQAREQGLSIKCDPYCSSSILLTQWDTPPKKMVEVDCTPEPATEHASLYCRGLDVTEIYVREAMPGNWVFEADAGFYTLGADFAHSYRYEPTLINIYKPLHKETLWCETLNP